MNTVLGMAVSSMTDELRQKYTIDVDVKCNRNAWKHGNHSAREMARRVAMKDLLRRCETSARITESGEGEQKTARTIAFAS